MMDISDRQNQILDAAFDVFMRYGFRKASMQDIADAAGMSRAALYLHFRNKDDVFRFGLQRLYGQALAVLTAALDGEGGFGERLNAALSGYAGVILAPAQSSPHGADLFAAHDSLAGELVVENATAFQSVLAAAIRQAETRGEIDSKRLGATPEVLAQTLYGALDGIKTGVKVGGDAGLVAGQIGVLAKAFARGLSV